MGRLWNAPLSDALRYCVFADEYFLFGMVSKMRYQLDACVCGVAPLAEQTSAWGHLRNGAQVSVDEQQR